MRNLTSVDQLEFGPEKIRLKPPNPLAWRLLVSRKVLGDSASRKIAIRRCKADHHPQPETPVWLLRRCSVPSGNAATLRAWSSETRGQWYGECM